MNKTLLLAILVLAACTTAPTETVVETDAQIVHVNVVGPEYIFSPSTVKAGEPVQLIFDTAPPGCSRSFTIPSLGIAQVVAAGSTVEFTPQAGTIQAACSMNMYKGQLVAE